MPFDDTDHDEYASVEPVVPLAAFLLGLLAILVGALAAIFLLPEFLPGVTLSLLGPKPQACWLLARSSGIVAYLLLFMSVALGLLITNKMARVWPGGPTAVDLHQFTSLLGFAFAFFHALVLLGDRYISFTFLQILVPFASVNYRPFWVGLGQIAFYLAIPVLFSFYVRKQLGFKLWRGLHYGAFVVYSLLTIHALLAGTDTTAPILLGIYVVTGALVCFLTLVRILSQVSGRKSHVPGHRSKAEVSEH